MRTTLTILMTVIISVNLFCQEQKETTKMLDFVSRTGTIIKYEDYKLPGIKLSHNVADSKIRKIKGGSEERLFFQISSKGKYKTETASIAAEDLIEIQEALEVLKVQSEIDLETSTDYLENKFVTDDRFQIGYYVSKGKLVWFMKLDNYGDGTLFVRNFQSIQELFRNGAQKIEELK